MIQEVTETTDREIWAREEVSEAQADTPVSDTKCFNHQGE